MMYLLLQILILGVLGYCAAWVTYTVFLHPLRNIPGPLPATFSRYWLASTTMRTNFDQVQIDLHKKYGPLVRISHDEVSCSDPAAVKLIYSTQNPLVKTDFYPVFSNKTFSKHPDLFSDLDEKNHFHRRRTVNHVYSLSNILQCESSIDKCAQLFMERLGRLADKKATVDLGEWLEWYAFDVVGELFFDEMFGFLEKSEDHKNYVHSLDILLPVLCSAAVSPSYWRPFILGSAMFNTEIRTALNALEHINTAAKTAVLDSIERRKTNPGGTDLMQQLLDIVDDRGPKVDFGIGEVQLESYVAFVAGSDTNAISLRATFYNLLKHPQTYQKLQAEIDTAVKAGQISSPVRYVEAIRLPYLVACVKEGMRLHPAVALSMQRHAPKGGIELAGTFIPEGYRVGINANVVHRDKSVFGADADTFNPDRWLTDDAVNMEKHFLSFGAGTRTCIGKNISLVEMYKVIVEIMRHFEIELSPSANWQTRNIWFHKQTGLKVEIRRR